MGCVSNWLVFCVAAIELAELSVAVLFDSMLVGFLLSDEAVICSEDVLVASVPVLLAFSASASVLAVESAAPPPSLAASAPSVSALEDA